MSRATAYAHTNIALVKYWGKRDDGGRALNLPAVGSLSLTLDRFGTETTVELAPEGRQDVLVLDGVERPGAEVARVSAFLDLVRQQAGRQLYARVTSRNDVPTAAGLASSASAFCALAAAATAAFGLRVEGGRLSILARRGSGSAARSVYGGFVLLQRGSRDDGEDCFAEPIASSLDARLVVVRCGSGPKDVGSTSGMGHSQRTSPYFPAWVETHARDLSDGHAAVVAGDLPRLGEVMEHSTLKMHATTFSARPPFFYWTPTTLAALQEVKALRGRGTGAWATMDAGPHVKVLCAPADANAVAAALGTVPGVLGVDIAAPGPGARVLETHA
ncbi:MAG: diphosphomevalonate decarboxylase [Deltaproteobacteria bacterium]|nr:diphosphomevalonate decarboxylase [Deltaproteobacteria bacterium]